MKTLFATLLLFFIFLLLGHLVLDAIDQEMAWREKSVIERRVDQCGEEYRAQAEDAYQRSSLIGGEVHHLPDCRVIVKAGRI